MATVPYRNNRWPLALAAVLLVYVGLAVLLMMMLPVKDGVRDWFAPLIPGGWMAWSFPGAMFFLTIFRFCH
ncbi:hypothetical protein LP421_22725 [Rhizobium sp. RCAM05350]|nr:hypothetical protein LP421_22725 [Rhizobium sp. RCAM05350]